MNKYSPTCHCHNPAHEIKAGNRYRAEGGTRHGSHNIRITHLDGIFVTSVFEHDETIERRVTTDTIHRMLHGTPVGRLIPLEPINA